MRSLAIILIDPFIQIGLQFFDSCVNFLSESDLIELLQHRLVKSFADAVGLWASRFRLRVVDVLDRQVKLKLVMLPVSTIFRAAIGKNSQ